MAATRWAAPWGPRSSAIIADDAFLAEVAPQGRAVPPGTGRPGRRATRRCSRRCAAQGLMLGLKCRVAPTDVVKAGYAAAPADRARRRQCRCAFCPRSTSPTPTSPRPSPALTARPPRWSSAGRRLSLLLFPNIPGGPGAEAPGCSANKEHRHETLPRHPQDRRRRPARHDRHRPRDEDRPQRPPQGHAR